MKQILWLGAVLTLTGCAAQPAEDKMNLEQAVRDYIAVRELQPTEEIRTSNSDGWKEIDQNFIIYDARRNKYLVEFTRSCHELSERPIIPDVRRDYDRIRARFDTIRGCRIKNIYALDEADITELEALAEMADQ